jgi:hypothetical protein
MEREMICCASTAQMITAKMRGIDLIIFIAVIILAVAGYVYVATRLCRLSAELLSCLNVVVSESLKIFTFRRTA